MLAYCDYIADRISKALSFDIRENRQYSYVSEVGPVKLDLHPKEGYFLSTKKTLEVIDINGKKYKITVEEV